MDPNILDKIECTITDDFIGEFDCSEIMDVDLYLRFFKFAEDTRLTTKRLGFPSENVRGDIRNWMDRQDEVIGASFGQMDQSLHPHRHWEGNIHSIATKSNFDIMHDYNRVTGACMQLYMEKFPVIQQYDLTSYYLNVQKTKAGEGYHIWHPESDGGSSSTKRVLVSMIYLNDVEEGGETEFLYQHKRFKPKKGTVLIWPAYFTHTHRGNPPLSGDKYIVTSWIEHTSF